MSAPPLREDELVAALRAVVERRSPRVRVGIGDDAAVWQPSRSHRSIVTTDASVEGVHFERAWMSWREIGARAMTPNVSDAAAMGARPLLATVALGVPPDVSLDELVELYRGIAGVADDARCAIVGGDVVRAPVLTLTIALVGEVRESRMKLRDGARPGDVIACTGTLGASRAGLQLLRGEIELRDEALRDAALCAYRAPVARWREGLWLGASANVRAMIDCSDGLSTDLDRLAQRSSVGVIVERVPVAEAACAAAQASNEDPQAYALTGGEEYELLVAIAPRAFAHLAGRFRARFGRELYRIGVADAKSGLRRRESDGEVEIRRSGWDHLERRP